MWLCTAVIHMAWNINTFEELCESNLEGYHGFNSCSCWLMNRMWYYQSQLLFINSFFRCNLASLLTVALHGKLEYYTSIMKDLLVDLIDASASKNPKLMLRRTESVVEKMLTNWMSICMYSFLRVRNWEVKTSLIVAGILMVVYKEDWQYIVFYFMHFNTGCLIDWLLSNTQCCQSMKTDRQKYHFL